MHSIMQNLDVLIQGIPDILIGEVEELSLTLQISDALLKHLECR